MATGWQTDEGAEGLLQLRYTDEAGEITDLNAAELAEVLEGLVAFTSTMAKKGLFGDGPPPEIRVRPPREGSFIIDALVVIGDGVDALVSAYDALGLDNDTVETGRDMVVATALAKAIGVGTRAIRGNRPVDVDDMADGRVKVRWADQTFDVVPRKVWDELETMKRPTKRAMRKILAPLSDEADMLEVRPGSPKDERDELSTKVPMVVADRGDYRAAAHEPDDVEEVPFTFESEAQLTSIDFRRGEKWRVSTTQGTRMATIEDSDFLRALDQGMALHKNDVFDVTVEGVATTKNGRTTTEWTLTRVVRKRRGVDDGDTSLSGSAD